MKELHQLGWNGFFEQHLQHSTIPNTIPEVKVGRIIEVQRHLYTLATSSQNELRAEVSGRLQYQAELEQDYPVIGDWVLFQSFDNQSNAVIVQRLPRQTALSRLTDVARKDTHRSGKQQVLAANVDLAFIVTSLNQDFNLRRVERTLMMVAETGIRPVVVLSKADLCENVEEKIDEVKQTVGATSVIAISAVQSSGLDEVLKFLQPGITAILIGSSGVGKSTLVNWLLNEDHAAVSGIRETDAKGRHTTTTRSLYLVSGGGMIIDSPGIREIQLAQVSETSLENVFADISQLAEQCRFSDCQHQNEPGCAIQQAMENGELDAGRFQNYEKLLEELERKVQPKQSEANVEYRHQQKALHKKYRKILKDKQKRKYDF